MSRQIRRIRQRLDKQLNSLAYQGFLAKLGNRTKQVSTGVGDQVYVTTFEGQVIKVLNRRVPNNYGEVVIVGTDQYSGGKVEVLDIYHYQKSTNNGVVPGTNLVPPHTHSYYDNPNMVTWVGDAQVMPLNVLPYVGSTTVRVYPGAVRKSASPGWVAIAGQDVALLSAIPTSGARWVTLQANDDGSVDYVLGTAAADRESLTAADIPESTTGRPIMHIVLEEGRTTLYRNKYANDFLDPRFTVGSFAQGVVHNNLYGLQGGSSTLDEYYHLTGSQHAALTGGVSTIADDYHTHKAESIVTTTYHPSSVTVNAGSTTAGDVNSLDAPNDSDVLIVDEDAGTPGYNIEVQFDSVTDFDTFIARMYYEGTAGHIIELQIYNVTATDWDTLATFTDESGFTWMSGIVINAEDYISSGTAKLRIYQAVAGNPSHVIDIDYVALIKALGI